MKIAINLASQPFRRDRAMIVASTLVSLLLVGSLGVLIHLAIQDNRQLGDVKHEVGVLKQQIQSVTVEQDKLNAVVRKPENETVLERSVFINALLQRKGISWNQIFNDLEKTIPYNVKLTQIRPTIDEQGHVVLDMTVASANAIDSIGMLRAFTENPLFGNVALRNTYPPSQTEPLYRMALDVTYAQKL